MHGIIVYACTFLHSGFFRMKPKNANANVHKTKENNIRVTIKFTKIGEIIL